MRDIYIYSCLQFWMDETPDTTIHGRIVNRGESFIEIEDDHGYTQLINLEKLFAVVY